MKAKKAVGLLLLLILVGGVIYIYLQGVPTGIRDRVDSVAGGAGQKKESGTVHIGLLAPLSGKAQAYGQSLERGAQLAVNAINAAGGLLGQKVKLHVVDTRSTAGVSTEFARDLAQKTSLSLLIGTYDEEAALNAAALANEIKVPFIYSGNGSMKTCKSGAPLETSEYVWGLGLTRHTQIEPFLIHLADKFAQPETTFKVYYFSSDTEEQRATTDFVIQVAESLLFDTVGEEYVDDRVEDYFQRVRAIFPSRPNLLMVSASERAFPRLIPQLAKLGVQAEMSVAGIHGFDVENFKGMGPAADGLQSVARYVHEIDNDENRAFLASWKEAYGDAAGLPTEAAAVGGYGAIRIGAAAYEKAGSMDFQKFRAAMDDLEIALPQGKVVMNSVNHLLVQPLYAVHVKNERFSLSEFLGDVSHPGMEACSIPQPLAENEEAVNDPSPKNDYDEME